MWPRIWVTICNQDGTARTPLPFSFSFSLFFFLRLFSFPFCRSPCPIPCSFFRSFLSFRLAVFRFILVSPSSLLLSLPCFPWWRILLFCYFVSALHPPPRSLLAWSVRAPLACCLLSSFLRCWCWLIFIFLLFLPFSDFDLDIVCFSSCLFLVGTMLSPRCRFLLRLV